MLKTEGHIESFLKRLTPRQVAEILACTQCGECLRHCPVQMVTGRTEISPAAKIRLYRELVNITDSLMSKLPLRKTVSAERLKAFTMAVYECTTCGACGQNCPVGIDTQRLWPALRREMVERDLAPVGPQREIPENIINTGNPYGRPRQLRFSPWFPREIEIPDRAEYGYYTGCTGAYEAEAMVKSDVVVLASLGIEFTMLTPEEEVCCGFPLYITGQYGLLAEVIKRLIESYRARGIRYLICSCPCCVNMMKKDWPLFYEGELPFSVLHITEIVQRYLSPAMLYPLKERIIYHDPCYLSRGVGIIAPPREILRMIPGVELVEFERYGRNSRCCGAGGAARKVFHDNAIAMGRMCIDEAVEKSASKLVLSCPACYAKVNEALHGYDREIEIVDIMELIAGQLKDQIKKTRSNK